jgi:HEAT repeat protein
LTALQKALGDPLPPVRIAAARSLATLKASGKGVTEALVRLLRDPNHSLQGAALAALGRFGEIDMTAVEALIKIVDKKNDAFRGEAVKALGRLSESGGSNTNLRSKLFEVLCRSLDDPTVAYDAASSLRNFTQEITEEPLLRRAIYIYRISGLWRGDLFALINFLRKILEDRPLPIDEYNRDRILRTRATIK